VVVLIAALLVGAGAGVAVVALGRTRQMVRAEASPVDVALGHAFAREDGDEPDELPGIVYRTVEPAIQWSAGVVKRLSPARRLDLIRRRIIYAGLEARLKTERVLAYKAGAAIAGFLFGLVATPGELPGPVGGVLLGVIASFIPDLWLDSKARARQAEIARDLPEALDLLALTVEAGLGLEQGLELLVDNLNGPLREEINRLLRETGLGVSRRAALKAMRERTDVPDLSALVVALIQAGEMGTAISQVLKVQAEQVRLRRRQRAKEKAAQTPVKILFPVIIGIFPAIFVVTVGPGAISIMQNLFK
jgi:tight adherence protein C